MSNVKFYHKGLQQISQNQNDIIEKTFPKILTSEGSNAENKFCNSLGKYIDI